MVRRSEVVAGAALLCLALSPAGGQALPEWRDILRLADQLPALADLGGIQPNLPCARSEAARHLEALPRAVAWTRAPALVVFQGLPGQPEGARAVLVRTTRALRARRAVADLLAAGEAALYLPDLRPAGPEDRDAPFLALFVDEPPGEDMTCLPQATP